MIWETSSNEPFLLLVKVLDCRSTYYFTEQQLFDLPFLWESKHGIPCYHFKACIEPVDSSPECTLLACLDLRICHVAPNSKSMGATFPEFTLVAWSELAISEKLISLVGRLQWKLLVNWA